MTGGIPAEAVGASVCVLVYSVICLTLCALLVGLLISFGERWNYVTISSTFTTLSTSASIAQQLHYAFDWETIKQAQFEKAVQSLVRKGIGFGGAAQKVDQFLFFIQFYCYNVMSLNIFFWAVALFIGSWGINSRWLGVHHDKVPTASKIFAVLFPGLIVGLMQLTKLQELPIPFIIVSYLTMFISLAMGSLLLVLILYRYVKTRRLVAGPRRGGWWVSGGSKDHPSQGASATIDSTNASSPRWSVYDRALLTRFSIGFLILSLFEVAIIFFTLFQANNYASIAASGHPELSISSAKTDIALFIPGVTASLMVFLVFGTTKSWRQYRDLVLGGCRSRKLFKRNILPDKESGSQGLEFERLPSLPNTKPEEERIKKKEVESRMKMFVTEARHSDSAVNKMGGAEESKRDNQARIERFRTLTTGASKAPEQTNKSQGRMNIDSRELIAPWESLEEVNEGPKRSHLRKVSHSAKKFVVERIS